MTTWAGIDFDTHAVHVVLIPEEGPPVYERRELRGADAFERTRAVRDAMPSRGWWTDQGVVAVGIEEPQGVAKSTVAKLKAIQGAVLSGLPNSLLVQPLEPARWRKLVGLPGNASKGHVKTWVLGDLLQKHATREGDEFSVAGARTTYPAWIDHHPQDAMDAYCLALAVSRLTEEVAAA